MTSQARANVMNTPARDPAPEHAAPLPLLPSVAVGSRRAAAEAIRRYAPMVAGMARRFLPSSEVEDAAQEIFVELWQVASRFDPRKGGEAVFVATSARRRLIDRLRRKGRGPREVKLRDEPRASGDPGPERGVEARRAAALIRALQPERRRVLELCVCEGWTHAEAARMTGLPLGTVKSHLRRGLAQLRAALEAKEGGR